MIHYLVIGHACDAEQTWMHLMFNDEQPDEYLEKKFTNHVLEELGYDLDSNKEVYIDFIIKSKNSMVINHG